MSRSYSRIPRAVSMLITLKTAALEEDITKGSAPLSDALGCGKFVVAAMVDETIQALTKNETLIAELKSQLSLANETVKSYEALGLPDPDEMSDTDKQEIRELAAAQQKRREADEM